MIFAMFLLYLEGAICIEPRAGLFRPGAAVGSAMNAIHSDPIIQLETIHIKGCIEIAADRKQKG